MSCVLYGIICRYRRCTTQNEEKLETCFQFFSSTVFLTERERENARRPKLLKLHEPNIFKAMALEPQSMCVVFYGHSEGKTDKINSSLGLLDTFPIVYSRLFLSFGSLTWTALLNECGTK